jgi:hypothetical protein
MIQVRLIALLMLLLVAGCRAGSIGAYELAIFRCDPKRSSFERCGVRHVSCGTSGSLGVTETIWASWSITGEVWCRSGFGRLKVLRWRTVNIRLLFWQRLAVMGLLGFGNFPR